MPKSSSTTTTSKVSSTIANSTCKCERNIVSFVLNVILGVLVLCETLYIVFNNNKGKTKSKKVHQIYKKSDSVEDMAKATVDLISESSRSLLKNLENQENEQLNVMLRRTYVPRQAKVDDGSDLDKVMGSLHLF